MPRLPSRFATVILPTGQFQRALWLAPKFASPRQFTLDCALPSRVLHTS